MKHIVTVFILLVLSGCITLTDSSMFCDPYYRTGDVTDAVSEGVVEGIEATKPDLKNE